MTPGLHLLPGNVNTALTNVYVSLSDLLLRCIREKTQSSSCLACSGIRTIACESSCAGAAWTPHRSCAGPSAPPHTSPSAAPTSPWPWNRAPSARQHPKRSRTNSSPASSCSGWPPSPSSLLTCSSFSYEDPGQGRTWANHPTKLEVRQSKVFLFS